jgi:hypothetical protein
MQPGAEGWPMHQFRYRDTNRVVVARKSRTTGQRTTEERALRSENNDRLEYYWLITLCTEQIDCI